MTKDETRLWVADLLSAFAGQENTLTIPRPYIAITGSIEAALLLSQIIYWSDRTKMEGGWFAKSYKEWQEEITLTKRQVSRAIPTLEKLGVETQVKRFNGSPTLHYRINRAVFAQSIVTLQNDGKLQNVTIEDDKTEQSSTEHTTEHTTEPIVPRKSANRKKGKVYSKWQRQDVLDYYALHTVELDMLVDAWGYMTRYKDMTIAEAVVFAKSYEQLKAENFNPAHYQGLVVTAKSKEGWKHDFSPLCLTKYITEYLERRLAEPAKPKMTAREKMLKDLQQPIEIIPPLMRKQ